MINEATIKVEQLWTDARTKFPEDELTVLVYLDSDQIALGRWAEGYWDIEIAPWDGQVEREPKVLHWMYLPGPPRT